MSVSLADPIMYLCIIINLSCVYDYMLSPMNADCQNCVWFWRPYKTHYNYKFKQISFKIQLGYIRSCCIKVNLLVVLKYIWKCYFYNIEKYIKGIKCLGKKQSLKLFADIFQCLSMQMHFYLVKFFIFIFIWWA